MTILSDLEYGKAWARQQGVAPEHYHYDGICDTWEWTNFPEPVIFYIAGGYRTEDLAYAALGRAVRKVHAAVPLLKENRGSHIRLIITTYEVL
jgi:hypothetical protein